MTTSVSHSKQYQLSECGLMNNTASILAQHRLMIVSAAGPLRMFHSNVISSNIYLKRPDNGANERRVVIASCLV